VRQHPAALAYCKLQEHRLRDRFGSRPISLISLLEFSAQAHFEKDRALVGLELICRPRPLPMVPPTLLPLLPKRDLALVRLEDDLPFPRFEFTIVFGQRSPRPALILCVPRL
jgi:hypothetical protein